MSQEYGMTEDIFEVGTPVSIEIQNREHLSTHITGWEKGLYLTARVVYSRGRPAALQSHDRCTIRFIRNGTAYGFETEILSIQFHPFPIMFLKYPAAIEQIKIRRFSRIRTDFPAVLADADGIVIENASVIDLSEGGCGLRVPDTAISALLREHTYKISFTILEKAIVLDCVIRKTRSEGESRILGIEFSNILPHDRETIRMFLDVVMNIFTSRMDATLMKLKLSDEKLSGHLDELPLTDILQLFEQSRKEGILHIATPGATGVVSFGSGLLRDASFGPLTGEDALVELLCLKEGGFHFFSQEIPQGSINMPITFALMETSRLIDEKNALQAFMPGKEERFILQTKTAPEEGDMHIIASVVHGGALCLDEMHLASGLSFTRAAMAVAKLIRDGFLVRV